MLAWNPMGHELLAGHLDFDAPRRRSGRPNIARLIFLDPHGRELFPDWKRRALNAVGHLRAVTGRFPADACLVPLIGELTMRSEEFAALWNAHPVRECGSSVREYRHPLVGTMNIREEVVQLTEESDQRMAICLTEPSSAEEDAIRLLADMVWRADTAAAPLPTLPTG